MKWMTEENREKIFNSLEQLSYRNQIVVLLALQFGLRPCEILDLTVADVTKDGYMRIKTRKGGTPRCLKITPELEDAVAIYTQDKKPDKKLIDVKYCAIHDTVKRFMKKLGLQEYGMRSMRHTFAHRLATNGVEIRLIQKALGHKSLSNTGIYIEASEDELDLALSTTSRHLQPHTNGVTVPSWDSRQVTKSLADLKRLSFLLLKRMENHSQELPTSSNNSDGTNSTNHQKSSWLKDSSSLMLNQIRKSTGDMKIENQPTH